MPSPSVIGLPCRKRLCGHDEQLLLSQGGPVALGVLDQLVGFRYPDRAAAALQPIVEEDAGRLAALPCPGSVAEKPAPPEADGVRMVVACGGDGVEAFIDGPAAGEVPGMGLARIDDAFDLGVGEQALGHDALGEMRPVAGLRGPDRRHGRRLDELGRMRRRALDADGLDAVGLIEAVAELPRCSLRLDARIGDLDHRFGGRGVRRHRCGAR